MNRIDLTKYGFIRYPEDDFNDDGNHFTCYRIGKVRVSKLVDKDYAYIAATIDRGDLHYNEYSTLPHYKAIDALNGRRRINIQESDLIELYNDCVEYEKEYDAKVKEVQALNPSYEHILDCLTKINEARKKEIADIESKATLDYLCGLNSYALRNFFEYFKSLKGKLIADVGAGANKHFKSINGYTRQFYNTDRWQKDLDPSWHYKQCLEILGYK